MDTRNATSGDDFLPGEDFRDGKGRVFAEFARLDDAPVGLLDRWTIRRVETTGSTNDDLMNAGESGAPDRLVLVADHQTAGRGRLDRRWEAPPGANLLVSVLFRDVPDRPHQLTQAVALAAVEACRRITGESGVDVEISLKWPNDILVGARKLAGILAAASAARRSRTGRGKRAHVPDFVVVGLGLNVRWAPPEAVHLSEYADDVHRDDVLEKWVVELDQMLSLDAEELHARYGAALSTVGQRVRAELPSGDALEGRALGVDVDGRLEVLDRCAVTHRIDVADIVHLRPLSDADAAAPNPKAPRDDGGDPLLTPRFEA